VCREEEARVKEPRPLRETPPNHSEREQEEAVLRSVSMFGGLRKKVFGGNMVPEA